VDAQVAMARESHRLSLESDAEAARHRAQRDKAIRRLRLQDPGKWTMGRLAQEVGVSKQLIAHILRQEGGVEDAVHGGGLL
jgi:AraC-like DNA-binding protein